MTSIQTSQLQQQNTTEMSTLRDRISEDVRQGTQTYITNQNIENEYAASKPIGSHSMLVKREGSEITDHLYGKGREQERLTTKASKQSQ